MTYNPVNSRVIKAIGYDPDLNLLAVDFHDGRPRAAVAPFSASEFAEFMASPSKGTFFFTRVAGRLKPSNPGAKREVGSSNRLILQEPEPLGPLDTFHHDDCCNRLLMKANPATLTDWECPLCGTLWKPRLVNGVRHWEPQSQSFIIRTSGL